MRIYPIFFKVFFTPMNPEKAHQVGYWGVNFLRQVGVSSVARRFLAPHPSLQTTVMGLTFPSPFGVAAGFDKKGGAINALGNLGFGHIEIGTVTGQAQPGNPKPRLFRLVDDKAVINRMGFNNDGAASVGPRLAAARADFDHDYGQSVRPIMGVNIGKTKVVELEDAIEDYLMSTRTLAPQADYLVVNVSSPNTPGLRDLQAVETLKPLLEAVRAEADRVVTDRRVPLTVKIAPDLADEDIIDVARMALELKLDGIIATNTTIARNGMGLVSSREKIDAIGAGGLSGQPLASRALEVLRILKEEVGEQLALIAVGGVTTAQDIQDRLDAGADLVQGYTAFLYEGPLWAYRINRGLKALRRNS
ncbi:quinone-dependent dihydroorotate dehydrogenase [Rothia sp. ZJ932]|uniref:quinone-dependent dihydroorotate dehydrogenase n=1 Tax=Rothia sp. ZJ932 TaxID=2810516 RepID=UPI001968A231|nr:quinone-dependent dihydroorotate dehydrogenase [Rothia sp. ZJ932]QRZ60729.1 quinone-dependent dihydroorotate dehydrogenase [Rothia sp. ZJ932]